jgi:hypothetical protein
VSTRTEHIRLGHSLEIKLEFETNTASDTSVKIIGTNFGDELFWIAQDDIDRFTTEFRKLVEKYFI